MVSRGIYRKGRDPSMRPIRWGILSTAGIAGLMADTITFVNGVPPLAVSSRSPDKAKAFAAKYGIARAYSSAEELVSDPDVDIVYVATPMSLHYEHSLLCLTHGKSVFCEKAVTENAIQLRRLMDEAEKRGLLFMEAMWTKCLPSFLLAKEWIDGGKVGKVKLLKADFTINAACFDPAHRLFANSLGGGALLDLGSYGFHFVTGLLGNKPDEIRTRAHVGPTGVDFDSITELTYGDAAAFVTLSFTMEGKSTANLIGDKGSIFFDANFPHTPHIKRKDEYNRVVEDVHVTFDHNGYEYEVREAQKALAEGRTSSEKIPLSDSLAVMELMDSLRQTWGLRFASER